MWIRVQSFLQESTEAAQTLDCCIGTCSESGVYFTSGRKAGDVTFEQDKSVSRKHCLLRCVGDYDGLLKPRTQAERDACAQNPMGVCLVLESSGKAGCYIAELPPKTSASGDADGVKDSNAVDSEDEETDDEGISQRPSQHAPPASQRQQQPLRTLSSQPIPKTTTLSSSATTPSSTWQVSQWGEGTLVTDVQQAPATQRILGESSSQAKLVKLSVGESRVLNFSDAVTLDSSDNSNDNNKEENGGLEHHPTIAIQIGLNISVLQITWIPLALTFSRLPKNWNQHKQELYKIGATEEAALSAETTHLVTPEYAGTAKPLAAWCKGIPVVTPGFVEALLGRVSCTDPIPTTGEHRAAIKGDMSFFLTKPNPQLLSPYMVLTIDEGEAETLIQFAGAQVVPLHSIADSDAALAKAQEVVQQAQRQDLVCLVLASRKKLHNEIAALDHVFSVKVNVFAKAISQQNPILKDANGKAIALPGSVGSGDISSSTTNTRRRRRGERDDDSTSASSSMKKPSSSYMNDDTITDVNEPYTMTTAAQDSVDVSTSGSVAPYATETTVTYPSTTSTAAAQQEDPSTTSRSAPPKTRARDSRSSSGASSPMDAKEESFSHKDDVEAEPKSGSSMDHSSMDDGESSPSPTKHTPVEAPSRKTDSGGLGTSKQGGWFTVAPKDDEQRKAIRNRASRECEQNDGMKFEPAALSERTIRVSSLSNTQSAPRSVNPFRSGRQGPNFSRFRKNTVPDRDSSFQVHFVKVLPKESELEKQLSENQRELEEEERRADELFHDTASAPTRKRRRR